VGEGAATKVSRTAASPASGETLRPREESRLRSTSKGSPRGERANGLAESLDVLSEVFDIRKIIWRGRHATLEEER